MPLDRSHSLAIINNIVIFKSGTRGDETVKKVRKLTFLTFSQFCQIVHFCQQDPVFHVFRVFRVFRVPGVPGKDHFLTPFLSPFPIQAAPLITFGQSRPKGDQKVTRK